MLFNTWSYVFIFLCFAIPLYWAVPLKWRMLYITAWSILFYSTWRWQFSFLMIFSATVDYVCANKIYLTSKKKEKKKWLLLAIATNLSFLVFFKYTYFIYDNVSFFGGLAGMKFPALESLGIRILLPLGISFYTFETISYTIDVYKGTSKPARNFLEYLAFITFWPKLIAGPILRPSEIIPQFQRKVSLTYEKAFDGIFLILYGLSKKLLIADILASRVDAGFQIPVSKLSSFDVWVLAFMFGFQIYFDFSGYSDIAIGTMKLMGFSVPENFNWPYIATSPRDFWKRWHISLSSWIRDYLYIPLVQLKDDFRTKALFLTWVIMGLWHGAGWNFVLWGIYHALLIQVFRSLKSWQKLEMKYPTAAWLTMLPLSMLGWIFFRASSVEQIISMFTILVTPSRYILSARALQNYSYPLTTAVLLLVLCANLVKTHGKGKRLGQALLIMKLALVPIMICGIILCMRQVKQFIYFQF